MLVLFIMESVPSLKSFVSILTRVFGKVISTIRSLISRVLSHYLCLFTILLLCVTFETLRWRLFLYIVQNVYDM